jgi:predicted transcriptional regulator
MPVLSFKVDAHSAERIRASARAAKSSVSAYLREAALGKEERRPAVIVRRNHPVSGLPYNAAEAGRLVTDDEIRAALSDFP